MKKIFITLGALVGVVILAVVILAVLLGVKTKEADEAYDAGDYEKAYSIWSPLAQYGETESQFDLGWLYLEGKGVEKDPEKAAWWFEQAAENGHLRSHRVLGSLYANGEDVPENPEKAVYYFEKPARCGDEKFMFALGQAYGGGWGVAMDVSESLKWFILASENGHEEAAERVAYYREILTADTVAKAEEKAEDWRAETDGITRWLYCF